MIGSCYNNHQCVCAWCHVCQNTNEAREGYALGKDYLLFLQLLQPPFFFAGHSTVARYTV